MNSNEKGEFEEFRRSARIRQANSEFVVRFRNGVAAFRHLEGSGGADMADHPLVLNVQRAERDFQALEVILQRWPPTALGLQCRLAKSAELESQTLELLAKYEYLGSGAAAVIAKQIGKSPQYVRRIRKKRT